jgi:hypothetical protein
VRKSETGSCSKPCGRNRFISPWVASTVPPDPSSDCHAPHLRTLIPEPFVTYATHLVDDRFDCTKTVLPRFIAKNEVLNFFSIGSMSNGWSKASGSLLRMVFITFYACLYLTLCRCYTYPVRIYGISMADIGYDQKKARQLRRRHE